MKVDAIPQPDPPTLTHVFGWNVVQWTVACAALQRYMRMPAPNLSGAVHVRRMWRNMTRCDVPMRAQVQTMYGWHGWTYMMFAHAAQEQERLKRLSGNI